MYYSYYGLKINPFELAPDGSYVYMSETHKEGLATLRYGVIANKGFLLLTGGVGVGKTTILNALLGMLENKVIVCLLNNPSLTKDEFYLYLASKLDLAYDGNKSSFVLQFEKLLLQCRETGEKTLLVIDEAQAFSIELLEEVRLLSNLAGPSNVFSIFLVGQPEIREQLATSQLLPLRQRIGIRYHVEPLSGKDTEKYINFRLDRAGAGKSSIFTDEAVATIHEASQGNPRLINILCDHAMLTGFAKDLKVIDKPLIVESLEELRLPGEETLQTSEMRSRPKLQPSPFEFIKPSPQPSEFVGESAPQSSEAANLSDSQPADEVEKKPDFMSAEDVNQKTVAQEDAASAPEVQDDIPHSESPNQTTKVVHQFSAPQTETESHSKPQSAEVETQPEAPSPEAASKPIPKESKMEGEPDSHPAEDDAYQTNLQSSEISNQLEPTQSEVETEPPLPIAEAENQPSSQSVVKVNQTETEQQNIIKHHEKKRNTLIHFSIALVIMSLIILLGIILPAETMDLLSGV